MGGAAGGTGALGVGLGGGGTISSIGRGGGAENIVFKLFIQF